MTPSLLTRQILVLVGIIAACFSLSLLAGLALIRGEREVFDSSVTKSAAILIDRLSVEHGIPTGKAIEAIRESYAQAGFLANLELLDHSSAQRRLDAIPDAPRLPEELEVPLQFGAHLLWRFPSHIAKLASPNHYLVVSYKPNVTPIQRTLNPATEIFILAVVLASLLATAVLFYSLRGKAQTARTVLDQIRKGDLKARFTIGRTDGIGQLMLQFNQMADEIQRLVETIRTTEVDRMRRLQELAHDLRTPVASLKNLLETLQRHGDTMPEAMYGEVVTLSLKEVEYFARLVEDLLFLAQVGEPKYDVVKSEVDLTSLLEDEIEAFNARYPEIKTRIDFGADTRLMKGDSHLLRRLFRNALENAFSFARNRVEVTIKDEVSKLIVFIRDDGPGFSELALANFGEKRVTRVISNNQEGRLSVGLGSVIMKAVVLVHAGSLHARNVGFGTGAEVEICLTVS